ncbi:MAG: histidine kinase [Chitinophagaceae bacterium]|nr:histidine kinase [Chitinophagaceae bacterium]
MYKPLFQIYLICYSAAFAFLAVTAQLFQTYDIGNSFFLFFLNLAMAYLAVLFWRGMENRVVRKKNSEETGTDLMIFTVFIVLSTGIFSIVYVGFFNFLFAQKTDYFSIAVYSFCFFLFISLFRVFSLLNSKTAMIRQKNSSLDYILQSQKIMEVEILKYQIDPHFIFNAFNTLLFLINEDPVKANAFCARLAKVYRYVIFSQHKNLVFLSEELDFSRDYSYLQEIRHYGEISISFEQFEAIENMLVLPVSIQILIENAIKHNQFSEVDPLQITVKLQDKYVTVENRMRAKEYSNIESSKIGLRNLFERSKLIVGGECMVLQEEGAFKVFLPILKTQV